MMCNMLQDKMLQRLEKGQLSAAFTQRSEYLAGRPYNKLSSNYYSTFTSAVGACIVTWAQRVRQVVRSASPTQPFSPGRTINKAGLYPGFNISCIHGGIAKKTIDVLGTAYIAGIWHSIYPILTSIGMSDSFKGVGRIRRFCLFP